MPIDLTALATTVVTSFLVPYANIGLEKIAENAGKKVGENAGEYVSDLTAKLWARIQTVFNRSEDKAILTLFEQNPNEMIEMLVKVLHQKLEQDPVLAKELNGMVSTPGPDGQNTGAQIMNASVAGIVDMRNADLSHAQHMEIGGVIVRKD